MTLERKPKKNVTTGLSGLDQDHSIGRYVHVYEVYIG